MHKLSVSSLVSHYAVQKLGTGKDFRESPTFRLGQERNRQRGWGGKVKRRERSLLKILKSGRRWRTRWSCTNALCLQVEKRKFCKMILKKRHLKDSPSSPKVENGLVQPPPQSRRRSIFSPKEGFRLGEG